MGVTSKKAESNTLSLFLGHSRIFLLPQRKKSPTPATTAKVATLLIIPVIAAVAAYFLVRSRQYAAHGDPRWIRTSSQIYTTHGVECQILIYGDSTAITGLDSRVIERETGLSTCNIAQTKGAIVVLGTTALDRYLQRNKRPQYLLIQFSGADFYRPTSWADTQSFMEGGIALIRYYPGLTLLPTLFRHPEIIIGMMRYAYSTAPANWLRSLRSPVHFDNGPRTHVDVHFVVPEAAYTSCQGVEDVDPMFHRPDTSFTTWLRKHYGRYADHLIVDVAPTSPCDPHVAYLRHTLSGIDNSLQQYPLSFFNEGWDHYTEAGSEHLSLEIAHQIMAFGSNGSLSQRSSIQGAGAR